MTKEDIKKPNSRSRQKRMDRRQRPTYPKGSGRRMPDEALVLNLGSGKRKSKYWPNKEDEKHEK